MGRAQEYCSNKCIGNPKNIYGGNTGIVRGKRVKLYNFYTGYRRLNVKIRIRAKYMEYTCGNNQKLRIENP